MRRRARVGVGSQNDVRVVVTCSRGHKMEIRCEEGW